jgi:hypothetical protein
MSDSANAFEAFLLQNNVQTSSNSGLLAHDDKDFRSVLNEHVSFTPLPDHHKQTLGNINSDNSGGGDYDMVSSMLGNLGMEDEEEAGDLGFLPPSMATRSGDGKSNKGLIGDGQWAQPEQQQVPAQAQAQAQAQPQTQTPAVVQQQQQQQTQAPQLIIPPVHTPVFVDMEAVKEYERKKRMPHARKNFHIPLPNKQHEYMTQYDLISVLRTQLNQLSTSNPGSDDFYHQVYMQNHGQEKRQSHGQEAFLKPARRVITAFRNPDGSPRLPDGTLGKIAASNLRKPKRLLNIGSGKTAEGQEEENEGTVFSSYALVYLIEEGFKCLIQIEDADNYLAALPPPNQQERQDIRLQRLWLLQKRANAVAQLAENLDFVEGEPFLTPDHMVMQFVKEPRGRLLLFRSLLYLTQPHNFHLACTLMHDIENIVLPSSEHVVNEKMAQVLCDTLFQMPMSLLNACFYTAMSVVTANPDPKAQLVRMIKSKMGCMIFLMFAKKGHRAKAQAMASYSAASQRAPQNPQLARQQQMESAQWDQVFGYWMSLLDGAYSQLLAGLTWEPKPAQGEQPESKEEKVQTQTTLRSYMWELLAVVMSHLPKEQVAAATELLAVVQTDLALTNAYNEEHADAPRTVAPLQYMEKLLATSK